MLGRVDPQMSLLDAGSLLGGLVDPDSFYGRLAEHGRSIVCDEDFADLLRAGPGPALDPALDADARLPAGVARRDLGPGDRAAGPAEHRLEDRAGLAHRSSRVSCHDLQRVSLADPAPRQGRAAVPRRRGPRDRGGGAPATEPAADRLLADHGRRSGARHLRAVAAGDPATGPGCRRGVAVEGAAPAASPLPA